MRFPSGLPMSCIYCSEGFGVSLTEIAFRCGGIFISCVNLWRYFHLMGSPIPTLWATVKLSHCSYCTVILTLCVNPQLSVLCGKLSHMRFEPSGWSGNPKIGYAKSLMDYIARWLELRFLTGDQSELFKALPMPIQPAIDVNGTDPVGALGELIQMGDAPACNICGSLMVRSGTCYRCMTCGGTSGCS